MIHRLYMFIRGRMWYRAMEGNFRVCFGCGSKGRWVLGGLWGRSVGWKLEEEGFGKWGFEG